MSVLTPSSPEELAALLGGAASQRQSVALGGRCSKRRMAGAVAPSDLTISTSAMDRVLVYEPQDLTISVQSGMPWCRLASTLADNRQMIPLDPPFFAEATVGGVVAANTSGPRRRLYGTARDFVIGMQFASLEGKLVQSGGMVVKNVAGLDMAKLLIGSFGTLAAIAVVNFKTVPMPPRERTFLLSFHSAPEAVKARDRILAGALQPAALDLLNPAAASRVEQQGWVLALDVGGNAAVLERYARELRNVGRWTALDEPEHSSFWQQVRDFTPRFLESHPEGAVVRLSTTLSQLREVVEAMPAPALARAGSGVCYGYFTDAAAASAWLAQAGKRSWKAIMEFAPENRAHLELWPQPGNDLETFERIKRLFDPHGLVNRGRLYNRI
ncbi:MAG: FAD-binding oxidoreductase [Bryobacterales bacterium]|nr:FAD-binding oxidoreductase [Bryobacterales bacterium]